MKKSLTCKQDRSICSGQCQRTLQIHPTLGCNLFCKHCYSSSGPSVSRIRLDVVDLVNVISDAYEMGYKVVAFSGGEPLMYNGLDQLLIHAKSLGMKTTITTNGTTLVNEQVSEKIKKYVDLLAISLDGPPQLHNEIRGSKYAFERLLLGLDNIRDIGIKFGFIHTLTANSWEHLLWIAEFAAKNNASLLQIHPLEIQGRADNMMQSNIVSEDILARVYLITLALASKYRDSMIIQFDAFRRDYVLKNPELVYASDVKYGDHYATKTKDIKLADLLNFLVVGADGSVLPIAYNFSKQYELCNIKNKRLSKIWPSYIQQQEGSYMMFRNLCQKVFREISNPSNNEQQPLPFFNWYELIVNHSYTKCLS
jgi:Fe-coproporphyrin III synthase